MRSKWNTVRKDLGRGLGRSSHGALHAENLCVVSTSSPVLVSNVSLLVTSWTLGPAMYRVRNLTAVGSNRVHVPEPSALICQVPLLPPLQGWRGQARLVSQFLKRGRSANIDLRAGVVPCSWVIERFGEDVSSHA